MGERLRVETDFANSPGLFSSMHTGRKHLPVALIPEDPMNSLSLWGNLDAHGTYKFICSHTNVHKYKLPNFLVKWLFHFSLPEVIQFLSFYILIDIFFPLSPST